MNIPSAIADFELPPDFHTVSLNLPKINIYTGNERKIYSLDLIKKLAAVVLAVQLLKQVLPDLEKAFRERSIKKVAAAQTLLGLLGCVLYMTAALIP